MQEHCKPKLFVIIVIIVLKISRSQRNDRLKRGKSSMTAEPITAQAVEDAPQCGEQNVISITVGDIVDVKGFGRATVIEPMVQQPDDPYFGRYLVRYHEKGTTYWCRPALMRRMHPTKKRILVARSTSAYRDAIMHNIDWPDVCLEIGCHEGLTTNIISNRASFVTGVDTAETVVGIAQRRHPHLTFHKLDGLRVDATRALSTTGTFTRICIDISGKAPLELVCQMIVTQASAFPEASLIVKNEELFDELAARELRHIQASAHQHHSWASSREVVTNAPRVQPPGQPVPGPKGRLNGASPPVLSTPTLTRDEHKMLMRASAVAAQQQRSLLPQMQVQEALAQPEAGTTTSISASGPDPVSVPEGAADPAPAECTDAGPGGKPVDSATTNNSPSAVAAQPGGNVTGGGDSSAVSPAMVAKTACGSASTSASTEGRLEMLLGQALLSECEVFRHQFQLPRTRPKRLSGTFHAGAKISEKQKSPAVEATACSGLSARAPPQVLAALPPANQRDG
ncbi:hypothetical protein VaNZ11_002893, partial [Volvox africanus]